jgi:hypothetical protein
MCEEMELRPVPPLRLIIAAGDGGGAARGGPAVAERNAVGRRQRRGARWAGDGEHGGPVADEGSATALLRPSQEEKGVEHGARCAWIRNTGGEGRGARSTMRLDKEEGH